MFRRTLAVAVMVIVGVFGWTTLAQQAPTSEPSMRDRKMRLAQAVEKESAPTEQHKALAVLVGKFDQTVEVRLGSEPLRYHCVAEGKWIMGGRYVRIESTAAPDEEVKGDRLTVYGYDTRTKKYTLWGIDSMSTFCSTAQGDFDAEAKTLTLVGDLDMPGAGKTQFHWVLRMLEGGKYTQEIQIKAPNGDFVTTVVARNTPLPG